MCSFLASIVIFKADILIPPLSTVCRIKKRYTAHIANSALFNSGSRVWVTSSDVHECRSLGSEVSWTGTYAQDWESEFKRHLWAALP